jgi:hypothetical protein
MHIKVSPPLLLDVRLRITMTQPGVRCVISKLVDLPAIRKTVVFMGRRVLQKLPALQRQIGLFRNLEVD